VPLADADFIAAGIGEELGLVGITAVLVIYLILGHLRGSHGFASRRGRRSVGGS